MRVAGVTAGVAVLLLIVAGAGWWLAGGRWMIVASPSMGQAAPVGTVVFTRPVTTRQLHVGDIISFRSPINPGEIYTHRVVAIDPAGAVHTRGDINGATDPAALHTTDIIGKVVARGWALGWLIRALPTLLVGGAVLWLVTRRWANLTWRVPLRIFGGSVLVAVAAALLQPFVAFVVLTKMPTTTGTDLTLVSTGILPIRLTATGGAHLDLLDGQLGTITGSGATGPRGIALTSTLHLTLWWWITLILIWLTPLLPAILTGRPPPFPPPAPPIDDNHTTPAAGRPVGIAGDADEAGVEPGAGTAPAAMADRADLADLRSIATPRLAGPQAAAPRPGKRHRAPQPPGLRGIIRPGHVLLVVVGTAVIATLSGSSWATAGAFTAKISNSGNIVGTAPYFTCAAAAAAYSPFLSYPLADTATGITNPAADVSGNTRTGTYGTNIAPSPSNPCSSRDTGGSIVLSGTGTTTSVQTPTLISNPTVFTETIRFKTTTGGGRLIGFGNLPTGTSTQYDRHMYLSNTGQVVFGVYNNGVFTAVSPATYLDGNWHQATATLSAAGMALYMDGNQVAVNTGTSTAENHTGYWRIGYDNLNGWGTTQPTNFYYTGNLAYAAIYTTALTPTQIKTLYVASS